MPTVTIYGKPDCHLCDQALAVLERLARERSFDIEQRDITEDDRLHRAYFERIPVIVLDGQELSDYFVDEERLREALDGDPARAVDDLESRR